MLTRGGRLDDRPVVAGSRRLRGTRLRPDGRVKAITRVVTISATQQLSRTRASSSSRRWWRGEFRRPPPRRSRNSGSVTPAAIQPLDTVGTFRALDAVAPIGL